MRNPLKKKQTMESRLADLGTVDRKARLNVITEDLFDLCVKHAEPFRVQQAMEEYLRVCYRFAELAIEEHVASREEEIKKSVNAQFKKISRMTLLTGMLHGVILASWMQSLAKAIGNLL